MAATKIKPSPVFTSGEGAPPEALPPLQLWLGPLTELNSKMDAAEAKLDVVFDAVPPRPGPGGDADEIVAPGDWLITGSNCSAFTDELALWLVANEPPLPPAAGLHKQRPISVK
ncbi:hypothetical protein ACLBXB_04095 [Methylobacterium mesophilicum]